MNDRAARQDRSPDEQIVDLLGELLAEMRGLRADLARDRRRASTLTRADCVRLEKLLPAIVGRNGSDWFVTQEVLADPAIRLVADPLNVRQVGRLFRRAVGQPIAGLVVERGGSELHRTLWRVVKTI